MLLRQIIEQASKGYEKELPESSLMLQCHDDGTPLSLEEYSAKGLGDTLGRFVVIELSETYDDKASKEIQVATAIGCLERVRRELDAMIESLEELE